MFDIRHLRHALALAEHRNFARAAAALHITQPALTRSIRSLEDHLGARLFDRGARDVTPTGFGELVLRHAQGIDFATRDLDRELQLAKGLEVGRLDVGVGPWGAAALVGTVVGRLSQRYPRLRSRVVIAPWQELPARVRVRDVDLMMSEISEVEGEEDLEVHPLQPHRVFAVCRPGHPLTQSAGLSFPDIFAYPLAGPNLPAHAQAALLRMVPAAARSRIAADGLQSVTCDSSSVLKAILANSDAVSLMSPFMLMRELRDGELVMLAQLDPGVKSRFGVTRLRGRTLSAPAAAFIELLAAYDRELAAAESELIAAASSRKAAAPAPKSRRRT